MQVTNRSFIVTGGASGLGAACVRRLVADGGRVVFAGPPAELVEADTLTGHHLAEYVAARR